MAHAMSQVSIFTAARAHTVLSHTSLLQVLGALSPLQLTGGSTRPAVEPGWPQVLPQEGCNDGCYFEGTTKLWPAVSFIH